MIQSLNEISPWLSAFLFIGVAELYSIGLMLLSRQRLGIERLRLNNEVAGFKFAVVGVLYAVLLAFVVIAVWENYSSTEGAVRNETKALLDLDRVSRAFPDAAGAEIRGGIRDYAREIRNTEWQLMRDGDASATAEAALERLSETIFAAKPKDAGDAILYDHALKFLTIVNDNRAERLDSASGTVPGVLWVVLIVGALITLGYPAFFASTSLVAQILMTASLAALVALTLFVAAVLSYPFTGTVHVSPEPVDHALERLSVRGR